MSSTKDKKSKIDKAAQADTEPPVSSRDKSKSRDKDKSKEREKEKSKSRDKDKSKDKEREKSKSKDKDRTKLRSSASGQVKLAAEFVQEEVQVEAVEAPVPVPVAVVEKSAPVQKASRPKEEPEATTSEPTPTPIKPAADATPLSTQISPAQALLHPDIKLQVESLLQAILDHAPAVVATTDAQTREKASGAYVPTSAQSHVFNAKLQDIFSLDESLRYKEATECLNDFVRLAENYAKIIISELNLPIEEKSLRPTAQDSNTFLVKGLLLRVARDYQVGDKEAQSLGLGKASWKFGGANADDDAAARHAGHAFAATNASYSTFESNGITIPLVALVDYSGYRVAAEISLPTSDGAALAIFGSAVSTESLPSSSAVHVSKFSQQSKAALDTLNVDALPKDSVGFRGSDGKYYLTNLSSMYPIFDSKKQTGPRIRPELARKWNTPVSGSKSSEVLKSLQNLQIPSYVSDRVKSEEFQELFRTEFDNINDLHRYGINFRHIGAVRAEMHRTKTAVGNTDGLFLAEMISRVLKNQVRSATRAAVAKLRFFSEEPSKQEFLRVLNTIVQASQNDQFWKGQIKNAVLDHFGNDSLHSHEKETNYNLFQNMQPPMKVYLVWRLCALLGVELPSAIMHDIRASLTGSAPGCHVSVVDFSAPRARVKTPALLSLASGVSSLQCAFSSIDADQAASSTAPRLLGDAKSRLLAAYDSAPFSSDIELWVAKCYLANSLLTCPDGSSAALSRAAALIRRFRSQNPKNLDAARVQAVVELLLVIAGSEKDMKHMSDHVKTAKDCLKDLQKPGGSAVEEDILLWLQRIVKVRPDKVNKQMMDRFKAQAQATLQVALPEAQFESFDRKIARINV